MDSDTCTPGTLEEATRAIFAQWSPEELERLRLTDRADLSNEFRSAERDIRNGWGLKHGDRLFQDLARRGCRHGFEMSHYILEQVWRRLNDLPVQESYQDRPNP